MKRLRTIAALSAVLTPLMAEVAFSVPLPDSSEFPRVSNPEVYEPVCYIKTTGGSTLNLTTLCGTNATPDNNNAGNRANAPGNNNANGGNAGNNGGNTAGNPGNRGRNTVVRDTIASPNTPGGTGNNQGPNPGTSGGRNSNNGNAPGTTAPGNASPDATTTSDITGEGSPNPTNINLPRVPRSSFSPGGTAPTRDAIDGPRNPQ